MRPWAHAGAAMLLALPLLAAAAPAAPSQPAPQPLDATVGRIAKATGVPGLQVLVLDHNAVTYSGDFGVRNLASKTPVDAHTRFEIGSITKQFTAAAILQLRAQHKLALTDTLGKYVPQLPNAKNVTIEQMLWQVSGIPDYTESKAFGKLIVPRAGGMALSKPGTFDAILAMIAKKPLDFKPGTKWAYSNTNYVLLGRIVAITSGMPWQQYVRTHLFAPAGMTESAFMEDEAHLTDMATGYTMYKAKLVPAGSFNGWARGAGAIVSTASDLAKWDEALFGGKIVSAADLKLMTSPGPVPNGRLGNYGFGWVLDSYDKQQRIWHNGGTLGFLAQNDIYPGLSQAVIVLQSSTTANPAHLADAAFDTMHPELSAGNDKAAAGEDPALTARAKTVWNQLLNGVVDHSQFTDAANKAFTPQLVAQSSAQLKPLGEPTAFVYQGEEQAQGLNAYQYHLTFASGMSLTLVMALDAHGKIAVFAVH